MGILVVSGWVPSATGGGGGGGQRQTRSTSDLGPSKQARRGEEEAERIDERGQTALVRRGEKVEEEPFALVQKGHIGNSFIKSIFEANPRQISKPGKWKRSSSLVVSFPSWSHHTQKSNEKKATSFPLLPQPPLLYYHKHSPGEAQGREVPGKRNKRSGIALYGRGIANGTSNRCKKARPLVTVSERSFFFPVNLFVFSGDFFALPSVIMRAQQDVRGGNRCDAVFVIQRQRQKKVASPDSPPPPVALSWRQRQKIEGGDNLRFPVV